MCGIAGAMGAVDGELLDALRRASVAQVHRGPDAEGFWTSDLSAPSASPGVAFAHRRLAIIDLSADASQPMVDARSGAVIVYNGEVYNFRELRAELEAAGRTFRSRSDTEVVLQAYAQFGPDFVSRLRGMFALAIWDPARRCLWLARDRMGIKPLYVTRLQRPRGEALLFASEVRALLATGLIERRLDPDGLRAFLWHGFPVGPRTLVRNVRRLEPGSILEVRADAGLSAREQRYWQLPAEGRPTNGRVDELRQELEAAVRMRLVSDVPLGVFLSGGIDSSAVAALAVRAAQSPIRTFTVGFEETALDESQPARAVAKCLGTDHTEVLLTQSSFRERLSDALRSLDQPTFDGINTYFVSRAARESGITVALAGTGGDELFGGYASFVELPRLLRASRFTRFVPRALLRPACALVTRVLLGRPGAVPPQARFGKLADLLAQRRLLDLYQLSYALYSPAFLRELAPELETAASRSGLSPERAQRLEAGMAGSSLLHSISLLELASFVGERLLADTDTTSMGVSLEVRVPLLDHGVIETLAGVDPKRRFLPLGRKQLLREVALSKLAPELFAREKQGFELPLGRWIREELRGPVGAVLGDEPACRSAGLAPRAVAKLWRAYLEGAPGIYWSRVWALYVLLGWCERNRLVL